MSTYPPNIALPIYVAYTQVSDVAADLESRLLTSGGYNIRDSVFGAKGDGATDDSTAVQGAINACSTAGGGRVFVPGGTYKINSPLTVPAGVSLIGTGEAAEFSANVGSGTLFTMSADTTLRSISVTGTCGSAADVTGNDCIVSDVRFRGAGLTQCVRLFAANNLLVDGCLFSGTGYGVIQQATYASNKVRVVNCYAENMMADFVECNCTTGASNDWVIANNAYAGANSYPTPTTEQRFVGLTNIGRVVIANNIIENSAGDAPIHMESTQGDFTVIGNTFRNCVGASGNTGYIYVLNTAKRGSVTGNTFVHDDTSIASMCALDMSSGVYTGPLLFSDNTLIGNASRTLNAFRFGNGQSARVLITGNIGTLIGTVIPDVTALSDLTMSVNDWDASIGITCVVTSSSGGGSDMVFSGNVFRVPDGNIALKLSSNSSGTGLPTRHVISGNRFTGGTVTVIDGVDVNCSNNTYHLGQTFTPAAVGSFGTATRITNVNNVAFT